MGIVDIKRIQSIIHFMRLDKERKVALVLSGGGLKAGAFHLGVCQALKEKGFVFAGGTREKVLNDFPDDNPCTIRTYVGSSAGAVICAFLAAGYDLDSIRTAFFMSPRGFGVSNFLRTPSGKLKPLTYKDLFHLNGKNLVAFIPKFLKRSSVVSGGIEAFLKSGFKLNGLFTTQGLEKYLREQALADCNHFKDLGVSLFIVATQLNHSRKVIFGDFEEVSKDKTIKYANFATISDAAAASASLPPVFAPYEIPNQKGKPLHFFDGEIRDTLSTHVAADHGANLIISSSSIQPYHYNKEVGSLADYGIGAILNQALYQLVEQKIARHTEYNENLDQIFNAIEGYFSQAQLPPEHRDKLIEIIQKRIGFRRNVKYIHIHPEPQNHEFFFADHFSLNQKILGGIIRAGFKAAINTLRSYNL